MITVAYTIYPDWPVWSGEVGAQWAIRELASETAKKRGWRVAGISFTEDGHDQRGRRVCAVVDYRETDFTV